MKHRLLILLGAVLLSTGGLGIKLCSFGNWQLAAGRSVFSIIALVLLFPTARKVWTPRVLLVGLAFVATNMFFVSATKLTTAANAIFLEYSAPLWVLVFSPLLLAEPVRRRDFLTLLVTAGGLVLFFVVPERATALSPGIVKGNWLALGAGIGYAFILMGLRWLKDGGGESAIVAGSAMTTVACMVPMLMAPAGSPGAFTAGRPVDWLIIAGIGVVSLGLGYACCARGMRGVPAAQGSLLSLIEPVLNPFWVWLVFRDERPGPWALIGGALILSSVAYQALSGPSGGGRSRRTSRA
jgi:drug/metabolite transporter (DMT)-like permease